MKKEFYDLIVIGAGSGGLNVSGFFSRVGLRILLIDKTEGHIGGDCLNTGCVPSKALIHYADTVFARRSFQESSEATPRIAEGFVSYVKKVQETIRQTENKEYLKNKGIDFKSGNPYFVSSRCLILGGVEYTAKNFVIATGSRPRELSISSDKSIPLYTNENIFLLQSAPRHFVFVGGGPISCELGQAFSRLGSRVSIIHTGSSLLEKETQEARDLVAQRFLEEGIEIYTNSSLQKIQEGKVFFTDKEGRETSLSAEALFVGIGRIPNTENLGLEEAGVLWTKDGKSLLIDEYLRTTNPHIYVVGDVSGGFQFTHAAEKQAAAVIYNMLSPFPKKYSPQGMAWVTYTRPEVATFGISEKEALENGYEKIKVSTDEDDRFIIENTSPGFVSVYVNKKGRVMGGTIVSDFASELSHELILAMDAKLTLKDIFKRVHPYPTRSRIVKKVAALWLEKTFTEQKKKIVRFLY